MERAGDLGLNSGPPLSGWITPRKLLNVLVRHCPDRKNGDGKHRGVGCVD